MSHHISNNDPKGGGCGCHQHTKKEDITIKDLEKGCCCCCPRIEKIYIPVPRTWGDIIGNIQDQADLIELIQSISSTSSEKEVINVLTYSSSAPANPEKNNKYANSADNCIYTYDGDKWVKSTPSAEAIYITADTTHMYAYNAEEEVLVDITGQKIDNTIYTTDLVAGLKPYLEDGIYRVCYTTSGGASTEWYTMSVMHSDYGSTTRFTQILQNKDGYAIRYATQYPDASISWGHWQWYRYSFEGRNAKKPHLDVAFFGDVYNNDSHELGYEGAGSILVRDKNNAIQDDDYIILYYWDRRNHRIAAFAGGNGDKKIYPVRWGTLPYKSWKHRKKGWKDDWRELPYKMSDIMQRITYLTPEEFNDLMWEGGYLKHTLLGTMSFVGGPRGNGYSTKLWIGVARGVSYNVGEQGKNYAHFVVEDLMHRIPFYLRCLHKPGQVTENDETTYVKGHVEYSCSHTRKPHLNFKKELDIWRE